jgi:hypothetical protein
MACGSCNGCSSDCATPEVLFQSLLKRYEQEDDLTWKALNFLDLVTFCADSDKLDEVPPASQEVLEEVNHFIDDFVSHHSSVDDRFFDVLQADLTANKGASGYLAGILLRQVHATLNRIINWEVYFVTQFPQSPILPKLREAANKLTRFIHLPKPELPAIVTLDEYSETYDEESGGYPLPTATPVGTAVRRVFDEKCEAIGEVVERIDDSTARVRWEMVDCLCGHHAEFSDGNITVQLC